MKTKKIIFFVEDPGSSNFVLDLNSSLKKMRINSSVYASGFSKMYLKNFNQPFIDYDLKKQIIYNCDLLIVGTSENTNSPIKQILKEAKKKKIKTGIIIDAPNSLSERLKVISTNIKKIDVDFFFTADKETKKKLSKNFNKRKIINVLNPKFEWIKKQKIKKIKNKKKQIIFLSELSQGLNEDSFLKNKSYKLEGFSNSIYRTEIVFEELIMCLKDYRDNFSLILRLHPKEKKIDYKKYLSSINMIHANNNPIKTLVSSDLVVGLTTNMLCEATLLNIPVLSITPRKNEFKWINSDFRNNIKHVYQRQNIKAYLKKFFEGKIKTRKFIIKKKTFAETLNELVKKNSQ